MEKRGFLLVAVIGISVIVFFSMVGLAYRIISEASAPDDETLYDYDDYAHVGSWSEIESKDEDYFLVYLYEPGEETSESVKNDVCALTEAYEDQFPVYFAVAPIEGAPSSTQSPAFLIFENGSLEAVRSGEAGIYSLLDDAESGLIP